MRTGVPNGVESIVEIRFSEVSVVKFLAVVLFSSWAFMVSAQDDFDPLDPEDDDAQTGVAVGARIPDFRAVDQNGESWDFDRLKGPNGAVLVFHRSADW